MEGEIYSLVVVSVLILPADAFEADYCCRLVLNICRHWELHEPTVDRRPDEKHGYNVKMCATYDWEDAFRIASAQGVVRCEPEKEQISVLNYIYDVTSDV